MRARGIPLSAPSGGWGGFDDDRWTGAFPKATEPAPLAPLGPGKPPPSGGDIARSVARIAVALLLILGAAVGATYVFSSHPSTSPAPTPAVNVVTTPYSDSVYGDPTPAALKRTTSGVRQVCTEEIRALPTRGHWRCLESVILEETMIGVRARETTGPCTHRVASATGPVWSCWTKIAVTAIALSAPHKVPVMFGVILPATSTKDVTSPPTICRAESRPSKTHGPWTCANSQQTPKGWRFVEPVDPGGPCSYRVADEQTGVWSCQPPTTYP